VKGLLSTQKTASWQTTQDTAFVALAISAYFKEFEANTDFVERLYVDGSEHAKHKFRSSADGTRLQTFPIATLINANSGHVDVTIKKVRCFNNLSPTARPSS
jgi:hypothetical protein